MDFEDIRRADDGHRVRPSRPMDRRAAVAVTLSSGWPLCLGNGW